MSDVHAPAPPAANTWDVQALTDAVRLRVRGNPGDDDEDRLQRCVNVAVGEIDEELDRLPADDEADPPVEAFDPGALAYLFEAAVDLAVAHLQARDEDIPDPDPVALVRARVRPAKARWGLA